MKAIKITKALKIKMEYEEKHSEYRRIEQRIAQGASGMESYRDYYREQSRDLRRALLDELDRIGLLSAIDEAEGKASVRKISPDALLEEVLNIIEGLNIPAKYLTGCTAWIDHNAQSFPGAYKGSPESTQFRVEWRSSGCYITTIIRDYCLGPHKRVRLHLTDNAKQKVFERVSRGNW